MGKSASSRHAHAAPSGRMWMRFALLTLQCSAGARRNASVNYEFPTFTNGTGQRHQGASEADPTSVAGVIATDSPQPQAEVWFGLLKTNPEENLSIR